MKKRPRLDANHKEIAQAFGRLGYLVLSLAGLGAGVPDLLVYRRDKGLSLVEVKGATGTLTPDQVEFQQRGWPVVVTRTIDDVLNA
jgi:hypothetical protein